MSTYLVTWYVYSGRFLKARRSKDADHAHDTRIAHVHGMRHDL